MKSKSLELDQDEDILELRELDDTQTDAIVDDYKDMQIDMVESSRGKRLGWNKYTVDKVTGFNENDR
jgi:hypothetical protein